MSLVSDAVTSVDSKVDLVSNVSLATQDPEDEEQKFSPAALGAESSPRIVELLRIVKALSQYPALEQDIQIARIKALLVQSGLPKREFPRSQVRDEEEENEEEEEELEGQELAAAQFENDVEWLLLGKAAVQIYGLVMQTLLDQIIPLSEDIWYWDDIVHSYRYSCLYTVQSSPLHMWAWTTDIYQDSIYRFRQLRQDLSGQKTVRGTEKEGGEMGTAKETKDEKIVKEKRNQTNTGQEGLFIKNDGSPPLSQEEAQTKNTVSRPPVREEPQNKVSGWSSPQHEEPQLKRPWSPFPNPGDIEIKNALGLCTNTTGPQLKDAGTPRPTDEDTQTKNAGGFFTRSARGLSTNNAESQGQQDDEAVAQVRVGADVEPSTAVAASRKAGLSAAWGEFYSIVRQSIAERSIGDLRRRVLSPVDVSRAEARRKRADLLRVKATTAAGLGMLMAEGFNFNSPTASDHDKTLGWRGVLERSVYLMDMLLQNITAARDLEMSAFEDKVFETVYEDPDLAVKAFQFNTKRKTSQIATRLLNILRESYPYHVSEFSMLREENGRPSRLVRYWLPAVALLASSSTLLRIFVRRKQDIATWIRELGATTRDFYLNWVVEPVRKIIATIRHDNNSEIALMSRDSLKADRESLERMVVDFALDRPDIAVGASTISESQIADIRAKVGEGDVTPILKAYERDLRKPFVGAIKGDLVRALLVQIQKTKVDLEVAISGIDSLLKSQELVFGFVGLTPGVLVSLAMFRYLGTILGGRVGLKRSQKARRGVRVLRNIHRILAEAIPREQKHLSYQDHGLLVYEVHVLRNLARGMLPSDIEKEFIEDLGDLVNLKSVQAQVRTGDRIRWAYPELWK